MKSGLEQNLIRNIEGILKGSPVMVFEQDLDLRYTSAINPLLLFAENIIGKTDSEIFTTGNPAELIELKKSVINNGAPVRRCVSVVSANDYSVSLDLTLQPVSEDGVITGLRGIAVETGRKSSLQHSDAARTASEAFGHIFESTNLLLAYLDRDFNFIRVNRAYAAADGKTPEYFAGKNHFDLYPNAENREIFESVVATGEPYIAYGKPFEYKNNPERGVTYWDWSLFPVKDSRGRSEGLVLTLVNVTKRKTAEQEVDGVKKKLDDIQRLSELGKLSSIVAHELRNPLATISLGVSNIKRKLENNLPIIENINRIEKKVAESSNIIDNLLFYAKMKLPEAEAISFTEILRECAETFNDHLEGTRVDFILEMENARGVQVKADAQQMKEVAANLLHNAFDALQGKKGRIKLSAGNESGRCWFAVRDNGTGIPDEIMDKIFDPFFTTQSKGTGLGLSVCKEIVSLHNGEIKVDNCSETGTEIKVFLPVWE